jgi:methionine synthase / methylenetetrahydrofolate reductase (NADH)
LPSAPDQSDLCIGRFAVGLEPYARPTPVYSGLVSTRFLERLANGRPIVADGGMGAILGGAVPGLRCPEEANVRAPESVVAVHAGYIAAGAELIETNTFGATRPKLARLLLDGDLEAILSAGVRLAREAREVSGREVFVAGSIGPAGEPEAFDPRRHAALYAETARVLEGRGVDLFCIETFFDVDELETAIEAVQAVSSLPIVAALTFDEDGETIGGVPAGAAAARIAALGVAALGTNHGVGPSAALLALELMSDVDAPLVAMPNVGIASLAGGRVVYPHSTPRYFADFAARAEALGARIVGGCCGTTPAQITAIREAFETGRRPSPTVGRDAPRDPVEVAPAPTGETALARAFAEGLWVVSVELDPPKGGSLDGLVAATRRLAASGKVGFVDVNDNPMARARMNALMTSVRLQRETGVETIPHVTPRDATVMGLEGLLLGAHAEGVRNLLAVTGDPPNVGDYPGSHGVYELDAIGVVEVVSALNRGVDYTGKTLDAPTSFFCGVAVNPTADDLDLEIERFRRKVDAGARFAMTQALFEVAPLERFGERLGGWPVPVLLGVWPLRSEQLALRLHNEVPGISVPDAVLERLRAAGPEAPTVGLELARDLVARARPLVAGIYVIPPFKQPEAALELL